QLLPMGDMLYLRIADDRGWTCGRNSKDGEPCLVEVLGDITDEERMYTLPKSLDPTTHVLCGPSLQSEVTGEILAPGDVVQIIERFTPLREVGG
ncbi:hypothetical protein, partial [Salmonella sp. s58408]|uniref:hypothetical protein n=1 Tax=Salmonella sp. s58408 TaxID=3159701 RepID=UPI003980E364